MTAKPIVLRAAARRDVDAIVEYYVADGAFSAARQFVNALEIVSGQIAGNPAAGSLRYSRILDIPDLRFRKVGRFPHLVFYVERDAEIDIWRILHGNRDIPSSLRETTDD